MADDVQTAPTRVSEHNAANNEHTGNRLGAFLCWAVVFADIGTSVYYTPGILYNQVHLLAGLFVTMTMVAFLLLTLKYSEVSVRFPEGGGVVTVAARGLNPWAGAVGGMFILVDYFLTSAISSDSGLTYLSAVFSGLTPYILPLTILIVALLGVLNWWGIKESASVSAAIAVAAFIIDLVILLAVFIHVPSHAIGEVIGEMFSGSLTPVTLLTGFAGSFLAFSGLESISQLSPVMRLPRRQTVTVALTLVVVTVGVTSPLLTIFSTTLLTTCTPTFSVCSPHILQASLAAHQAQPNPDQFISELAFLAGGTAFGRLLEILTAITASTLLVFASNTAIIGAYHVFLALSRMRFFPAIVERRNKFRDTPHVSIALATGIPILVLIAVRGNITILGDMYAFGLLGAFSLTCLALDVIRWRERASGTTVPELAEESGMPALGGGWLPDAVRQRVRQRLDVRTVERLRRLRDGAVVRRVAISQRAEPATRFLRALWPDAKYYLGFLTTLLVSVAWCTNLVAKPLATEFGGGVTVLGVVICIIHFRYQQSRGEKPVFPMGDLRRIADSLLVVLTADSPHNQQVIQAACESADGHTLVFLYDGHPVQRNLQVMQFNAPYFYDEQAQRTFSQAANACQRAGIPSQFVYRTGGAPAVLSAWRIIRPDEIIADAAVAKKLSAKVAPEYVRFQQVDGVRVAHYIRHHVSALDTAEGTGSGPTAAVRAETGAPAPGGPAASAANGRPPASAERQGAATGGPVGPTGGRPAAEHPRRTAPPLRYSTGPKPGAGETGEPAGASEDTAAQSATDIANYVWTGTQLVRKDELEQQDQRQDQQQQERDQQTPPENGTPRPSQR